MLSQQATAFLSGLCDLIPAGKYTIRDWEDLHSLSGEGDAKEMIDQLKINGCVDIKYKSDSEICFALTDKATLVSQEYKSIVTQDESCQVVTNNAGNVIVVSQSVEPAKSTKKVGRLTSFVYGLLGGLLGGCIGGGVVHAILTLIGG
ncbi:MAG: hypothetical protein ACI4M5_05820 [Christensenellales bacterium]